MSENAYPTRAADWLHEQSGRRFWAPFTHGSYLRFRGWPAHRPTIDGNTAGYPIDFLRDHIKEASGQVPIEEIERRYLVGTFCVRPTQGLTQELFSHPRASLVFFGPQLFVFEMRVGDASNSELFDADGRALSPLRDALEKGDLPRSFINAMERSPATRTERGGCDLAIGLARSGFLIAADRVLDLLMRRSPDRYEVFHTRGWLAQLRGSTRLAMEAYEKALRLKPNASDVLSDRAALHRKRGDHDAAAADLDAALALYGGDANVWILRAQVAAHQGDEGAEIMCLESALELEPSDVASGVRLSVLYVRAEEVGRAIDVLESLLAYDPDGVHGVKAKISRLQSR